MLKDFAAGGAERMLLELHPHLPDVRFEVVGLAGRGDLLPAYVQAGLTPTILGRGRPLDPRWLLALRRLVERVEPDVIHAQLPVPAIGARLVGRITGTPVVYTEQTSWDVYHPFTRIANAATYRLDRRVIAVSAAVHHSILGTRSGRRAADKLAIVRLGIDAPRVQHDAEPAPVPSIAAGSYGAVTHLTPVKGPDVLVEAAALIAREFPDRRCAIAGDGRLRAMLEERVRALGAPVDLLGVRTDARSVMARLSVAVFPSRMEGLPVALLEAMALGRPIVATAVGGVPEAVRDGVSGLLVPPDDAPALAAAVVSLLEDPERALSLGEKARVDVVERFDIAETAEGIGAVYREVAGLPA